MSSHTFMVFTTDDDLCESLSASDGCFDNSEWSDGMNDISEISTCVDADNEVMMILCDQVSELSFHEEYVPRSVNPELKGINTFLSDNCLDFKLTQFTYFPIIFDDDSSETSNSECFEDSTDKEVFDILKQYEMSKDNVEDFDTYLFPPRSINPGLL
ncbi:hypothetical protein QTN25_004172 [Entamoeba marina]